MSNLGEIPTLALTMIREDSFCLTLAFRSFLLEAASVCLHEQGHRNGVAFTINGEFSRTYSLLWQPVADTDVRTHGDPEVATEYGAYALAILLISTHTEYTVIERSVKGTGFDFWLGGKEDLGFQRKARLEVSGIRRGNIGRIRARLEEKIYQIGRPQNNLPAYIIIVEFGEPGSLVAKR